MGNQRKFKRAVQSFAEARLAPSTIRKLNNGVNRNFVDLAEREHPDLARDHREPEWRGIFPDVQLGPPKTPNEVIGEIKVLYEFTKRGFYSCNVAYDREKLQNRRDGFEGFLFQVVFFTELPGYEYPPGTWSYPGPNECPVKKHCGPRTASRGKRGIDWQYQYLHKNLLKEEPAWSALGEDVKRLEMSSEDELAAISRRYEKVFCPDPGYQWEFRPEIHLANAAVGCAIWSY